MTGQQLKNSILQLAIQGKLVPQDPNDEPASVLLERISKEKKQLFNDGKLKKKDIEPSIINEDALPFEAPEGWAWASLKDLSLDSADGPFGSNLKKEHYTEKKEVRIIQLSNIGEDGWKDANVRYTTFTHLPNIARSEAFAGDIIIAKMMPAGRAIICPEGDVKYVLSSDAVRFGFSECLLRKYLYYAINSRVFLDQVYSEVQGITRVRTSLNKLRTYCLPIPPINEQNRIVEIIEKLLPLIEKYGESQEKLESLNNSLPEALRKSILQEAIMGKLVPQDPTEEPASELLARIRKEKEQLVKEGKLQKKDLAVNPITDEEKPFDIPESWEWCRLGDCVSNRAGLAYSKGDLDIKSNDMIRVLRGGNISYGEWRKDENDVMISREFVKDELLLKKGTFITPAVTSLENMGKTALIEEDLNDTVVGGFVLMLQAFLKEKLLLKYLLYFFASAYYKEYCKSITNKSGQAFYNISRAKLMDMPIPMPPLNEQQRIVSKIEQFFELIK